MRTDAREVVFHAIHDQIETVMHLDQVLAFIERLPLEKRKSFNYEAQIVKVEEEIERYRKLKLRLYEDLADGVITKSEYTEFRNAYTARIEEKSETVERMKKEQAQAATTGMTNRAWVKAFAQFQNISELDRRVLVALVDRIFIYENKAIEIQFKYRDEYELALRYVQEFEERPAAAG